MLEFQSALERDAALDTLATLVKQKGGAAVSFKPTGPLAAVKQQLLDEDRHAGLLYHGGYLCFDKLWQLPQRPKGAVRPAGGDRRIT